MEKGTRALREGYTTGACAAAAAKGATLLLAGEEPGTDVEIPLPAGGRLKLPLEGWERREGGVLCRVRKFSGDDPDVTHGSIIAALARPFPLFFLAWAAEASGQRDGSRIIVAGGEGVGVATKPGLAVPPGMPAINPAPMAMIKEAVGEALAGAREALQEVALEVEVRVPLGAGLAAATANPRLGILGGLSILGTTGILKPFSTPAWEGTIACALDVAQASGLGEVILCPGRTSEGFVRRELMPPEEAIILIGDHVAFSLEACRKRGFGKVVVVGGLGKLSKMAAGELRTHMSDSSVDFGLLARWVREAGAPEEVAREVAHANTAREVGELLEGPAGETFFQRVAGEARKNLSERLDPGAELCVLLLGPGGELLARAGAA